MMKATEKAAKTPGICRSLRRQAASFAAAGRGFWAVLRQESHLRFHLAAAAYVLYFSRWYALGRGEYAVLFTLFGLVLGLECVNTALERLCDRVCPVYDPAIGRVKDIAAGAVLAAAVCALFVALALFGDLSVPGEIWRYHWEKPWRLAVLLLSFFAAGWFVCGFSPRARKDI